MRLVTVGAAMFVLTGWLSAQQVVPSGVTPVSIVPSLAIGLVGTGGAQATVGGTLFTSVTPASTTDLLEDTLITYTLPANTLAVNGRGVRLTATGSFAANANNKAARLYFGATQVGTSTTGAFNGTAWSITAIVFRTGATAQLAGGLFAQTGSAPNLTNSTPAETLSSTLVIKVTGQGATAIGDITANLCVVEAL